MQLPGKNLLARFSISSLGNTKLNICCATLLFPYCRCFFSGWTHL